MKKQIESTDNQNSMALLQIDFSENYTCLQQDEIQSAHWHQHQVSLFTALLWHTQKQHPIVIASDNLEHSKNTIVAYLDQILSEPPLPSSIKVLHIWSDGPASQFKNKYIAAAINVLQQKYGILINWNYFATAHGKGPVDGIGAVVKRQVWDLVKKRKCVVTNAEGFVAAANKSTGIYVRQMNEVEIHKRNETLGLGQIFSCAASLPGLSKNHCLKNGNGQVVMYRTTNDIIINNEDISRTR